MSDAEAIQVLARAVLQLYKEYESHRHFTPKGSTDVCGKSALLLSARVSVENLLSATPAETPATALAGFVHVAAPPGFGCQFCNKPDAEWCPVHGYRLEKVVNPPPVSSASAPGGAPGVETRVTHADVAPGTTWSGSGSGPVVVRSLGDVCRGSCCDHHDGHRRVLTDRGEFCSQLISWCWRKLGTGTTPTPSTETPTCKRCGGPRQQWQVYCGAACSQEAESSTETPTGGR